MEAARSARWLLLVVLGAGLPVGAWAQGNADTLRAYDVVSIKPERPDADAVGIRRSPTGLETFSLTLADLIQEAYGLVDLSLVKDAPAGKARYHVTTKLGEEQMAAWSGLSAQEQQQKSREMLQALLAERFQLKVHTVKQTMDVYALTVDKKGAKLKEVTGTSGQPAITPYLGDGRIAGIFTISQFVRLLALVKVIHIDTTGRPIVDRTGLTGKYVIELAWTPLSAGHDGQRSPGTEAYGTFESALTGELGLRLVAQKMEVDAIVVDHAEEPAFD